jgi:site-specific recombinase XerC
MNKVLTETLRAVRMTALAMAHVVCTLHGEPYCSFRTAFERMVRKGGRVNFIWPDLRHTFASRAVICGVALPTVKEFVGYKTIAMTLRYTHLSMDHKQRTVSTLEQVSEQSPSNFYNSEHRLSHFVTITA